MLPVTSPVWFSLSGGGSYIRRSGAAYEGAADKDDIGGVVGAAVGFHLGSMLSFYVAADDYIYGTRIDETTLEADKKTQNDVHLSVGFGFPLGGRLSRLVGTESAVRLYPQSTDRGFRHPGGTS